MATARDPRKSEKKPPFPEQRQDPPGSDAALRPQPDHGEKSYTGHGRLLGRKALVTGADSGIGRAVAIAFAREGADVALCYLPEEDEDANETARWVQDAGVKCLRFPRDIRDPRLCREMVEHMLREFGGIDILANIAGFQMTHSSFLEIPAGEVERVFETNVYAMMYLCQAAVPQMPPGAAIINTASIQAYQPSPSLVHYAASKAAIANFTKGLSQELADRGIRVNAVAPGPVWTPLIPASHMKTEKFGEQAPLKRPAQPVEMAPIYVLLASNEASYVTGMIYGATGGELLP